MGTIAAREATNSLNCVSLELVQVADSEHRRDKYRDLEISAAKNSLISVAAPPRASQAATERAKDDEVPVASEIRATIETLLNGFVMLMKEPQRGDWVVVDIHASRGIPTTKSSSLETFPHAPMLPRSVEKENVSKGARGESAERTVHPGDARSGLSSVHVLNRQDFYRSRERDGGSEGGGSEEGNEES